MPTEGPTDTVTWYFRVDPKKIVLIKSMLEGYEGLVVVRTADPKEGIVQLLVSPDFLDELEEILADLSGQIWMEAAPGGNYPLPFGS